MYSYTRKSVDSHSNSFFENEQRKLGQTSPFIHNIPSRPRFSSNEKRYDYSSEYEEPRQVRPRTPSATQFAGRNKFDPNMINQSDYSHVFSNAKGKRISKNYVGGLGNVSYGDSQQNESKQKIDNRKRPLNSNSREQNMNENQNNYNRSNHVQRKEKARRPKEDEAIKASFEKLNEEQILQKIGRINKLNSEINGRLQNILARVSKND